jgi:pimeloyl-ACP methyl ester carboxylesterase
VAVRQLLFVQGGGAGTHDAWDNRLVDSLRRHLADGYEIRYPRMPDEDDPRYATWSAAIARELAGLDDGAVVIGHSVGGTILAAVLASRPPSRLPSLFPSPLPSLFPSRLPGRTPAAIVLIAAPFVGAGGWPGEEFELPHDLGARLPQGVPLHVFHGLRDETAPPSHAELYRRAVPQAQLHLLPGRDHQLDDDLGEVARVLGTLPPA